MTRNLTRAHWRSVAMVAGTALFVGCADETPLEPETDLPPAAEAGTLSDVLSDPAISTLRRVTARYHRLEAAIEDGFVLLHPCEERPGEGPVGAVYVHFGRALDGVVDPEAPDALIYEPTRNGRERLVGAEFAVPFALWDEPEPPQFLGVSFQPENEFGVWGLHIWLWRHNPEGLFAEAHPNVTCGA